MEVLLRLGLMKEALIASPVNRLGMEMCRAATQFVLAECGYEYNIISCDCEQRCDL